jgi:hypothetical protein
MGDPEEAMRVLEASGDAALVQHATPFIQGYRFGELLGLLDH